ncbi:MAG: DUF3606 domain-containing protein [Polaromonas sp.]|nr:DUF3606 domain-containing protein [Polaromonas sp.]
MKDFPSAISSRRNEVALDDPYERNFWLLIFDCDEQALRAAMEKAGSQYAELRAYFHRNRSQNLVRWRAPREVGQ